jgi:small-conductance mechanosensitive channel
VLPDSTLLGSHVVNYSTLARTDGLILPTTVGIGYETPWRQVEAMLLEAVARTEGLLREPSPFVLQTSAAGSAPRLPNIRRQAGMPAGAAWLGACRAAATPDLRS